MRIAELLDILRDYPQEWEVELAVIAPVEDESPEITVDRYSIEGVLPWEEDEATRSCCGWSAARTTTSTPSSTTLDNTRT